MGVEGLAPILSTQEEKVNFWGKNGLEKGVSGEGDGDWRRWQAGARGNLRETENWG